MTIGHQQLRVDVRAGNGTGTCAAVIGASFEVLQPLVDALDPGIDIIRFDVPRVGGSPVAALPHTFAQLARMLDELGYDRVDVLGFSWGGALVATTWMVAVQDGLVDGGNITIHLRRPARGRSTPPRPRRLTVPVVQRVELGEDRVDVFLDRTPGDHKTCGDGPAFDLRMPRTGSVPPGWSATASVTGHRAGPGLDQRIDHERID